MIGEVFLMNKNIEILNEYIANLKVEMNNLMNLAFNVEGSFSFDTQKQVEDYHTTLLQFVKKLEERIKMLGGFPVTNLLKIEELSQIKSMQSREYSKQQVLDVLVNDFSYLKEYTKDLIKYFSDEFDPYTSHLLLDILIFLEQELYRNQICLK